MAEQSVVLYEQRDRTAIITINRPEKRNAMDDATRRAITDAWVRFRDDPEALVAVITGTGDVAFSAGNDLKEVYQGVDGDPSWVSPIRGAGTIQLATMQGLGISPSSLPSTATAWVPPSPLSWPATFATAPRMPSLGAARSSMPVWPVEARQPGCPIWCQWAGPWSWP